MMKIILFVVFILPAMVWGQSNPQRTKAVSTQNYSLNTRKKDSIISNIKSMLNSYAGKPDSPSTWILVRRALTDYLANEWKNGALMGDKTDNAFFIHVDRTTMTESDINQNKLVVVVGLALIKPSEFEIIRIEKLL